MFRRWIFAVAVIAAGLGCGTSTTPGFSSTTTTVSGTTGAGTNGTTGISGATVSAANFQFTPSTLTVTEGMTVTWRNDDTIDHTVTSGSNAIPDGKFDQLLHPGDTFQFTFTKAGAYPYFCRFHVSMGMIGSVSVRTSTTNSTTGTTGTTGTTTAPTTGTTASPTTTTGTGTTTAGATTTTGATTVSPTGGGTSTY